MFNEVWNEKYGMRIKKMKKIIIMSRGTCDANWLRVLFHTWITSPNWQSSLNLSV